MISQVSVSPQLCLSFVNTWAIVTRLLCHKFPEIKILEWWQFLIYPGILAGLSYTLRADSSSEPEEALVRTFQSIDQSLSIEPIR